MMRIDEPYLDLPFLQDLKKRNPIHPWDSMATVRIWHCCSQSARLSRSTVKV
jgi:hypothetical protein